MGLNAAFWYTGAIMVFLAWVSMPNAPQYLIFGAVIMAVLGTIQPALRLARWLNAVGGKQADDGFSGASITYPLWPRVWRTTAIIIFSVALALTAWTFIQSRQKAKGDSLVSASHAKPSQVAASVPPLRATPSQTGSLADPNTAFRNFGASGGSMITFGCAHILPFFPCSGAEECARPVPLLEFMGPRSGQKSVAIRKYEPGGTLFVDIDLGSFKATERFRLHGRNFFVDGGDWDANYNDNAVEVVDNESGAPIFQLIRTSRNTIEIDGVFRSFGNAYVISRKDGLKTLRGEAALHIPSDLLSPIFKHPYWMYPGQFASGGLPRCPAELIGLDVIIDRPISVPYIGPEG